MEELNKAMFAQVPLKYTGDPKRPVTVALEDADHYRIGVSPLWSSGRRSSAGIYHGDLRTENDSMQVGLECDGHRT